MNEILTWTLAVDTGTEICKTIEANFNETIFIDIGPMETDKSKYVNVRKW